MINLIPNEEKKLMVRNFYYRLATVFFIALGFCAAIACVVLLPSYFLSSTKYSLMNQKLEHEKSIPVDALDQETLKLLSALENKLSIIEKAEKNKFSIVKSVVNQLILKSVPDVKINQITFGKDDKDGQVVSIKGTAPSREKLLLFRQSLEGNSFFKKVDLPISNFVKGSNIQFYIRLVTS